MKYTQKKERILNCENCGKEFESKRKNARACSRKCISDLQNKKLREKKRFENEKKFKDIPDIPTCKICGWKSKSLQQHLVSHKLTVKQYKERFNLTTDDIFHSSYRKFYSERIKGEKNPAYGHGGKFSPFSKKFVKYKNLNEEEQQKEIDKRIEKANGTREDNASYTTRIEYYLNQGMSEEDAKEALSNRQTTFSLDICIKKYGEEKGRKVWQERQDKWIETLNALPEEEKDRINKQKMEALKNSYSMISTDLFKQLNVKNSLYGKKEATLKVEGKYLYPDFLIDKKVIEFYGDFWHANPRKYKSKDILKLPQIGSWKEKTAQDIWKRDKNRLKLLKESGYEVLVVWEMDYRKNKKEIVEKCLKFLEEK